MRGEEAASGWTLTNLLPKDLTELTEALVSLLALELVAEARWPRLWPASAAISWTVLVPAAGPATERG